MSRIKTIVVCFLLFFVVVIIEDIHITKQEGLVLSKKLACPYFMDIRKLCEDIEPDKIRNTSSGKYFYHYTISENPDYFIAIIVSVWGGAEVHVYKA